MKFKYGYCGPTTGGALVLQDKRGNRTTVITDHAVSLTDSNQYMGGVKTSAGPMTLFAKQAKSHRADPDGTIRMKRVILV